MEKEVQNIFELPNMNTKEISEEIFDNLIIGSGGFKLEKIISTGQTTPEGQWYDQEKDEWVMLIQGNAKLLFEREINSNSIVEMNKGDFLIIKAHDKHRVIYTSKDPQCIWLAFHGNFNK
jgi:cupin 2 domain-containing protein